MDWKLSYWWDKTGNNYLDIISEIPYISTWFNDCLRYSSPICYKFIYKGRIHQQVNQILLCTASDVTNRIFLLNPFNWNKFWNPYWILWILSSYFRFRYGILNTSNSLKTQRNVRYTKLFRCLGVCMPVSMYPLKMSRGT